MLTVEGDLIQLALQGEFDVIVHGANCRNIMGAGIAARIRNEFPEAFEVDSEFAKLYEPKDMLGEFSYAMVRREQASFFVVNAYTQLNIGDGLQVDYNAIDSVFSSLLDEFDNHYHTVRIGYPQIGAGLGGGDWDIISKIIDKNLNGSNHTLVLYKP